jgi:hypothetical protein
MDYSHFYSQEAGGCGTAGKVYEKNESGIAAVVVFATEQRLKGY